MTKLSPEQWRLLSPHLDHVLELTDDERAAWLSTFRAENPLLASQLEMLLQEHRELSEVGFLEECPMELPLSPGLAGQTFGVYTVISQIGQGGMGSVWLARRNDGRFERQVAIKILNVALMGKSGEERFKREGHFLGRLTHPHIAELLDAGVSQTGQPFLVLEYIEGDHLDRYCDQHRLTIRARIRLFVDVLRAVSQAHENLIVHRDLKPSNILVRTNGDAKLLDFGIAKLLESKEHSGEPPITLEGGRALTPEYAAPEQLKGEAVTTATDIYSAGVLLYVLLTGQHPAGAGPHTPATLLKAILETEPPRLSDVVSSPQATNARNRATTPDKLARLLRGDLDTIVAKALKKNPQERYPSIKGLADDLQRYLRYEPISARPDAIAYRAGKFVRRHTSSVAARLLLAVALLSTTLFTWFFLGRHEPLPQFNQKKLTANAPDSPILTARISPNGKYLGYADGQGLHLQLIATGAIQSVALPPNLPVATSSWAWGSWFPDSAGFIATVSNPGRPQTIWSIPVVGGAAEKLAEVADMSGGGVVSPDGRRIAYTRLRSASGAREIWVMGSRGEAPQKILTAESQAAIVEIAWSPKGNRLAYLYRRDAADRTDILVESCDVQGESITTILSDSHLSSFTWTPLGRFIYSRNTERGSAESDNLWELQVDGRTGIPHGRARQLTDWSGFSIYSLSATSDGKRLAFLRGNAHASVYVGELADDGSRLASSRRLTLDDNYNLPSAWTPDSREVIFSSERNANRRMYRQAIDQGSAAQLITPDLNTNFYLAGLSPDTTGILLEGAPLDTRKMGLYRLDPTSGAPRLLFNTGGFVLFWCSTKGANLCVFGRPSADKNELVVVAFDPLGGPGNEVLRIPLEAGSSADIGFDYWWQLSPDGAWIAIVKRHGNQIRLVPLSGGRTRPITVVGYSGIQELFWAIDSQSLYVSALAPDGAILLHVSLSGEAKPIWHRPQSTHTWGFPSRDGRHLAILDANFDSNVWMIGNF